MACELIGTGDGKLKQSSIVTSSKSIAQDIILEIVDNALDIAEESKAMEEYSEKKSIQEKTLINPLIGTGDQKSNEVLKTPEPLRRHPPVEKKNRLTDLVKNSKQVLARIMMSDSKLLLQDEKKEEEKVMEVIELNCVQITDLPFKSEVLPEEVPLPQDDSDLLKPSSDGLMEEIGLTSNFEEKIEKKVMTFPRTSGTKAKAAFVAKCRTLKREATNFRKKKWDVSGKIVNFFKKKRDNAKSNLEGRANECDDE